MKISIVTTCMNRLVHLQSTILKNIQDNKEYRNLEFILLNYNSKDGLDTWVYSNLMSYIETNRLVYLKYEDSEVFNLSHARNLAIKYSNGEIICCIDADNFTGANYVQFVKNKFNNHVDLFLTVDHTNSPSDLFGRMCFRKKNHKDINGFDEKLKGHGFEDFDFINRLKKKGLVNEYIKKKEYLKFIEHSTLQRVITSKFYKSIDKIFLCHVNTYESKLLFLFKNSTYDLVTIRHNRSLHSNSIENLDLNFRNNNFHNNLYTDFWKNGFWAIKDTKLFLSTIEGEHKWGQAYLKIENDKFNYCFYTVNQHSDIEGLIILYSQLKNRKIMMENDKLPFSKINPKGFGMGKVLKNYGTV